MGRKKGIPTKVLSARISKSDYDWLVEQARKSGKTISQLWKEILKKRGRI